jgi:hypothetical protein
MKRFVLAAIQELSRHETQAQADAELDLYEATTEITYVVLRLPDEKPVDTRAGGARKVSVGARPSKPASGRGAKKTGRKR